MKTLYLDELVLSVIRHPVYTNRIADWQKFRLTFNGGRPFIDKYLQQFTTREDTTDFTIRKSMSYCPAHSKSAILEIRNSVYERTDDILRRNGPASYMEAITGKNGGMDNKSSDIDTFIGKYLLPDLLSIGKIGVYVDKEPITGNLNISEAKKIHPYLYVYAAEDILSWTYDRYNNLTSLLLCETTEETDSITNLTCETKTRNKLFKLTSQGVSVRIQNEDKTWEQERFLDLTRIPFVIFELDNSLLTDVADYQIALLNIESSDVSYLVKSNFPFYTEQGNQMEDMADRSRSQAVIVNSDGSTTGTQANVSNGATRSVAVGGANGRRYPKGVERPGFINPSPDPIRVSMEKQEQIKASIRQLVHLALTNIKPTRASAESKGKDEQGLEAGLSIIGMELAYGERQIAAIWAEYEELENTTEIIYPDKYSLKSDEDRLIEAKALMAVYPAIPSRTFQREMAKRVADVTIGHKVNSVTMEKIHDEIDNAKVVCIDPAVIQIDHEAGLVSDATASEARQYPAGEAEQAAIDHAAKLARVSAAQSSPTEAIAGVTQDKADAKDEKKESQAPDVLGGAKKVRS